MIDVLRRDAAVRLIPMWLIFAPLFASVIEGVRTLIELKAARAGTIPDTDGQTALLALALWLPVAMIVWFSSGTPRCSMLDLALPTPARRLWMAHLIGTLGAGVIVLVAGIALLELRRSLTHLLAGDLPVSAPGVADVLIPILATLFLTLVVLQSFHPTCRRLPRTALFRMGTFAFTVIGYGLVLLLTRAATAFAVLPVAVGAALLFLTWRSVPQGFTLISKETAREGGREPRDDRGTTWTPRPTTGTSWTLARILAHGIAPAQLIQVPVTWLGAPMLVAWGVLLAGFPYGSEMRFFWMTLASYLLFAFWPAPLNQLGQLDPLPISRRKLFALLTLPGFGLVAAGYFIGRALVLARDTQEAFLPASTPVTFAGVVLIFLLFASIYLRTFRAHIGDGRRKAVYFGLIATFVVLQIGSLALMIFGTIEPFEAAAAFETGIEQLATGNFGWAILIWVVSAVLATGGYALTERQFRGIEIPTGPIVRES